MRQTIQKHAPLTVFHVICKQHVFNYSFIFFYSMLGEYIIFVQLVKLDLASISYEAL